MESDKVGEMVAQVLHKEIFQFALRKYKKKVLGNV